MDFTIVLKPAWISLILSFCLVHQTSQNVKEESIVRLQDLILGKFADLENKIGSMDNRLRQVDALIKNDIKPKMESMEAKVNKIESEVSAFEQSPSLGNILEGAINELKSQGNSIHAAINTLKTNTLAISKDVDNIGDEFKKGIGSMQLPFEELKSQGNAILKQMKIVNQVSKSCSSAVDNLTSQISSNIKESLASLQIHSIEANLNKSDEKIVKLLECKPVSGITMASLPWHTVGSDRFVRFAENMTWDSARILCQNNCMDLFKTKDVVAVAKYLDEGFSSLYHWIAGRGDGNRQVWVTTGEVVNKTEPWYHSSSYDSVGTDRCLAAATCCGVPEARRVLVTHPCTYNNPVLCG